MKIISIVGRGVGFAAIVLGLSFLLPGCNALGCKYDDVPGKAVITKFVPSETQKDTIVVTLDFTANDPKLQISSRHNMPNTFSHEISKVQFDNKQLAVGQSFPAVRSDITSGTCTPGVFKANW